MDNSWHPRPIQGNNYCPTCSISHFPFCPPHPYPPTFPGPTFEPVRGPSHLGRPVFNNHHDPFHDPGRWNVDPNLPPQLGEFNNNNNYNYNNNWSNNVSDDRSSKRIRVDGGENDVNFSKNTGLGVGLGFDGGVRRYPVENTGFDRNMMSSNVETGYRPEYGLGNNVNRNVYGVEGGNFRSDHQVGQYGQVANRPNVESFSHGGFGYESDRQSYGYRPPNYGNSFEHTQSNGGAMHYDKSSVVTPPDQYGGTYPPLPTDTGYDYRSPHHVGGVRPPVDSRPVRVEGYQSVGNQNVPTRPGYVAPHMGKQSEYGNAGLEHGGQFQPPQRYEFQPPLPSSPPPPLPMEPRVHWSIERTYPSSPKKESPSFFPSHVRSSSTVHYPHSPIVDSHGRVSPHLDNFKTDHAPHRTFREDSQGMLTTFGQYPRGSQPLPSKHNRSEKPRAVDAGHLFKPPHRTSRSDHFVIILRGLPGSGKSYFAKMLRDLELEHGGSAPRIHSMDDYFMTEVEKTEENDASKALGRGKKPVTKTVIEYCYEPEMEEAYRSSMLKAFKKTLEEGAYTFVIVDDRNLRVADFAQFWATAKRSGYEAYVLEAPYKDPAGCAARNVHGFTQDEVEKMAAKWEEAPSLYSQLDVKSLLHGDDLKDGNIEEVDMDTEDEDFDASETQAEKTSLTGNLRSDVSPEDERNSDDAELGNHTEEVKHLGWSKWSDNLDDDGDEKTELFKGKPNVLSGLLGTDGKGGKSVQWSDQGGRLGFSIGAVNKAKMASLVIGPGAGYNVKSNPLREEEVCRKSGEKNKHSVFKARLQAEQESFKAVFDRRRQRIGGVLTESE